MKNRVTHKAISSKYHNDLFKFMDTVSKAYDFSDSQMGDSGIHFLWKYMKPGLEIETLRLDNCKITNSGLSILLHGLTSVKVGKLYLRENQITKEGLDLLLYFVGTFKPIERINMEGNLVDKSLLSSYVKE